MTSQRDQHPVTYHVCIRTYRYGVPARAQRLQLAEGMSHSEAHQMVAALRIQLRRVRGRVELLHNEYSRPTYTVVAD